MKHSHKILLSLILCCLLLVSAICIPKLAVNQPSQSDTSDDAISQPEDTDPVVDTQTPAEPVVRNTDPVRSNPDADGKTVRFYLALPREIVEEENRTFYLAPAGVDGTKRSLKLEDGHLHAEESLRETAEHKYDFYLFRVEVELPEHTQPIYDLRSVDNDASEGTSPTYWTQIHIADEGTVVRVAPREWMLWEDDFSRSPTTGEFLGLTAVRYGKYYVSVEQRTLPCSDCPAVWAGLEQYTDCSVVYTTRYYKNSFLPEVEREEANNQVTFYRSSTSSGAWKTYISPEGAEDWVSIGIYTDTERVTLETCENSTNIHGQDWSMSRITVTFSEPVTTNLFEINWVVEDESIEGAPYECAHWHNLRLGETVLLREIYACSGWTDFPAANALIYEPVILCDECPEEWKADSADAS